MTIITANPPHLNTLLRKPRLRPDWGEMTPPQNPLSTQGAQYSIGYVITRHNLCCILLSLDPRQS